VALKSEFDTKSYRIVLFRSVVGAIIGSVPGIAYIFNDGHNLATNPFGMILIQTGSLIGAWVMGLGAVAGTIVATLKSRGTGPKTNRIKEYLNPESFPAIPPLPKSANKEVEQVETRQSHVDQLPTQQQARVEVKAAPIMMQPEEPTFEDFDR
jgi:hypothetical protein